MRHAWIGSLCIVLVAEHDWLDIALGVGLSAIGWLISRVVGRLDAVEERGEKHSEEIRDTRSAISRVEGHLDIAPFPYKN